MLPEQVNAPTPVQPDAAAVVPLWERKGIWIPLAVVLVLGVAYFVVQNQSSTATTDVAIPPKMNEDQIAERLQRIKFARNKEYAKRIIPDLVTLRFETLPGSCAMGVGEVSCGRNGEPRYTAYTHPLV